MLSELQCLAKASSLTARAAHSPDHFMRNSYIELAAGWRRVATMAAFQDSWHHFR